MDEQHINNHQTRKDILDILNLFSSDVDFTQRDLSNRLNISLGKTNYLLRELTKVGFLEIRNLAFRNNRARKLKYFLTKKGLQEKIRLTYYFLKEKEAEYNHIKEEWHAIKNIGQ